MEEVFVGQVHSWAIFANELQTSVVYILSIVFHFSLLFKTPWPIVQFGSMFKVLGVQSCYISNKEIVELLGNKI